MNQANDRALAMAIVRGDPMTVDERQQIERLLRSSSGLAAFCAAQKTLSHDLRALRDRVRSLRVPPRNEAELVAAFRARRAERKRKSGYRRFGAVASMAALVIAAGMLVIRDSRQPGAPEQNPAVTASPPTRAFQALPFGPPLQPTDAFTIVRARLGVAPLLNAGFVVAIPAGEEFVEADMLLGQDGTVHGIRFTESNRPAERLPTTLENEL